MKKVDKKKKRGKAFTAWMKERGFNSETFAQACNPPMRYGTVVNWTTGVEPRPFLKNSLKLQWPDCPLFR